MDLARATKGLLIGLAILPIAMLAMGGCAGLLQAMGDEPGGLWLIRGVAVLLALWFVDLIALVGLLALAVGKNEERKSDQGEVIGGK